MEFVTQLVAEFGEEYRDLIISALQFLDEREDHSSLAIPINRRAYIQHLIDLTTDDD